MIRQANGEDYITGSYMIFYGMSDIMRIVKSRRLRWAGHVTRMGNERGAWKLLHSGPDYDSSGTKCKIFICHYS